jgi:hypothetical protein
MAEGGCLCGAVRYRLDGPPLHADYCHCRMCQRAAGAPVVAWGTWPADRLTWLAGEARTFASSKKGTRSFCPDCGTPLTFVDADAPELVDVTLASLDDPSAFPPEYHIWTMSHIPWLDIRDELPRHSESAPDDRPTEEHRETPTKGRRQT